MHKVDESLRELVATSPFFTSLLLRLERETGDCHGLKVNGKTLTINPDWIEAQRNGQIKGALAAAALRCGLKHHIRRGSRDMTLWTEASALVVNGIVDGAGMELPDGEPLRADLTGMSIEQVYDQLRSERPEPEPDADDQQSGDDQDGDDGASGSGDDAKSDGQDGAGDDQGPPSCTEIEDGAGDAADEAEQAADWETAMLQASAAADARGDMPAGLAEIIEDLRRPDVDWKTLLFRYMQEKSRTSYSWARPNRALMPRGIRMPSLNEPSLGEIAIFLDTSSSMNTDLLAQVGGALQEVFGQTPPSLVHIVHCDTSITKTEEYGRDEIRGGDFRLEAVGRGGTSLRPPFDWIEENGITPAVAIYFTDLDGPMPEREPDYPVIWAAYNTDEDAPFGLTLRVDQ